MALPKNPHYRRWIALLAITALLLASIALWRMPELNALEWYVESGKPAMTPGPISLAKPLQWSDDYYTVADLGHGDFAIGEPKYGQCNFAYLITGTERAILFDTGPGLHDIRAVAQKLTTRPITAIPSHLHFDHVGNLARFESVALPDLPPLRRQVHNGHFQLGLDQYLGFVEGFQRPEFTVTQWIRPGATIPLGDRDLTLISAPGHTPDSVVLLDAASHRLFAGDFIYPSSIYAQLPGANLHDYADSAHRLLATLDETAAIYSAHGCDRLPTVEVPTLTRSDLADLERALVTADTAGWFDGQGWYPRRFPVNERMSLLAKYPWMQP